MTSDDIQAAFQELKTTFASNVNAKDAAQMTAYMKHRFVFYGIKSKKRKELARPAMRHSFANREELKRFIELLWADEHRELHYTALEVLHRNRKMLAIDDIPFLASLVTRNSWWDSVDYLASTNIGLLLKQYPDQIQSVVEPWIESDHLWLNRTAIIFQLKYKEDVDTELLSKAILQHAASKEFFHAKAIGWALRQYSKFDADWVRGFIEKHDLQPLSVREGSKYL